ncbi:MAG: radical SAM protein [Myxococcota bacterium]
MYKNLNPVLLSIDLEVTNICMNNCSICPREEIKRKRAFMGFETLKNLVKAFNEFRPLITISGMGDPLLHPELPEFIRYLRMGRFRVGVVVNIASLINLNPTIFKKVVESKPNIITVSIPSIETTTLEKIYNKGIKPELILSKCEEMFSHYRKEVPLRALGVITDFNENPQAYRGFFNISYNIPVWITKIHSRGGNLKRSLLYRGRDVRVNEGCNLFLFHSFIDAEGNLLSCCHDLTGETKFAHISEGGREILMKKREIIKGVPYFQICNRCDEPLRFMKLPKNLESLTFEGLTKKVKIY